MKIHKPWNKNLINHKNQCIFMKNQNIHSPFIFMLLGKIFILSYQRRKILCSLEWEKREEKPPSLDGLWVMGCWLERYVYGSSTPQRVPSFQSFHLSIFSICCVCSIITKFQIPNSFAPSALSYNKFLVQDKILIFMWKTTCNLLCQHTECVCGVCVCV